MTGSGIDQPMAEPTAGSGASQLREGLTRSVGWGVIGRAQPVADLDDGLMCVPQELGRTTQEINAAFGPAPSSTDDWAELEADLARLVSSSGDRGVAFVGNGAVQRAIPATLASTSLTIDQLPAAIGHRQWICGVYLLRESVTLFVAPGGQSKSTLALAMLISLASGNDFLGLHIYGGPKKVLFLSAEDSKAELTRRIRGTCQRFGIADADLRDRFFAITPTERQFSLLHAAGSTPSVNLAGVQALRAELDAVEPDVLAVDPLLKLVGGVNINDNSAATLLQGVMMDLAHQYRMAVLITHHTSKGANLRSQDAGMGAASLTNFARAQYSLEPLTADEARSFGIKHDIGSYFKLTGTKQNYSAAAEIRYFRRISITLPNAEPPTYPSGDSVGVVEPVTLTANVTSAPLRWTPGIVAAAVKAIKTSASPLMAGKMEHRTIIADAVKISTGDELDDGDVKRLIDHLTATGQITDAPIKVRRPDGNGYYSRKGLQAADISAGDAEHNNPQHPTIPGLQEAPASPAHTPQSGSGV